MSDVVNLELCWTGYRSFVLKDDLGGTSAELLCRMSFVAGAHAVMVCLEGNRADDRFERMLDEVRAMRMEVAMKLGTKE